AQPNTSFNVRLYLGDPRGITYPMEVRARSTSNTSGAFTLVQPPIRGFTMQLLSLTTDSDGIVNVDIRGTSSNGWVLDGIDLFTTSDPGVAPAVAAVRRYDLNTSTPSPTAAGFIGVVA